jgi:ribonuclease HII
VEPLLAEAYRLRLLRGVESELYPLGFSRFAGVDEVGRGCLAGPVVAAAVLVDPEITVPGVDDSKRLSPDSRRELAGWIRQGCIAWSVAAVSPATIDRINILQASKRAMVRALRDLAVEPDVALVDAVGLEGLNFPCLPIVRGDSFSYAIACASILAKVERDQMMEELDGDYPYYGFARHKGYAAPEHLEALRDFGPCPSHRLTFRSVLPRVEA